ncbi:MAG: GntR family transcriptional regulator [Devosia sp.]|nr:GntR family transcriptional regulator [Devosia sp.]
MARRVRKSTTVKVGAKDTVSSRSGETEDVLDRICTTLATAISGGALKPGSKILDDVIAEHFGVSRTVVRGALDILQRDHLIERQRNRGAFVAEPSVAEAEQLFEARYGLEREILALVVERATDEGLDRLEKLNEEEAHLPDSAGGAATAAGQLPQFHTELARLGGNDVLTEILDKVVARVSLVNYVYKVQPKDNCGDHRNILAAIRKRDLARARALMDEHLAELEGRVRLTPNRGDLDSFANVLKTFSGR